MRRRTFLQWLSAFFCAPRPGPAAEPPKDDILYNGTVWRSPWPLCHLVTVLFWDIEDREAIYVLLSEPYHAAGPGTAMMVCRYDDPYKSRGRHSPFYTEPELKRKLSGWQLMPLNNRLANGTQFDIPRSLLEGKK